MAKILENIEKNIETLPADLKVFLTDSATIEKIKVIADSFGFDEQERRKIEKIIAEVVVGGLNLYDMTEEIADQLGLEFDAAMDVNSKLYEDLFIDLEDDIGIQYTAHQASMAAQPKKIEEKKIDIEMIEKEKESHFPLIEKAVKKFNLFAGDEVAGKKFAEMAETFLSNVRTKTQFKNTLIKPASDGGLGMEKTMADDVAEFLASYSRLQPVIAKSEEKKKTDSSVIARSPRRSNLVNSDGIATPSPLRPSGFAGQAEGLAMTQKASLVPPNVKIEVSFEKEEKEAAAKKPKIEKMKIAAPKLLSVTEGVQSALAELNYNFPSSELQERLKSIIDARVRNVRTSIQTFDKLTQDVPSGGLGFSKLEADKVSLVLNKYLEDKNKDIYGSKLAEIKQAEDEEKKKNEERARAAEDAEKKNFDERFTKLTGKVPPPMPVVAPSQAPALTKKAEPRSELRSTTGEIAARKQISFPPEDAPYSVIPSGAQAKPRDLTPSKKQTGEISSQGRNDTKAVPPPRPVLEDIKFTPKLAGPLEEISQLTMDDFRKLSHDPKEAVLKIKDKLGLLRGESYKKYHLGIDAWRKSPLYGDYLKIINKSLGEGVSLDDAITTAKTLTKDEFDAIINSRVDE